MTGRYKGEDINREVITGVRKALQESNSQAWLVAENADHFPSDLDGFGWHGTMNYNGFMRPIWGWLSNKAHTSCPCRRFIVVKGFNSQMFTTSTQMRAIDPLTRLNPISSKSR